MIFDASLDGGPRILVESTAAADVAAVGVWYDRGSRDEDASLAGATHIIEHMLFKGTGELTASQIARRFDSMGGLVNAFTERETMGLHATIPVSGFAETARILTDLVTSARFDPDEFSRELVVIENEIASTLDDVEELAADAFALRYWGNHPLARPIGGTLEDIKTKTRDQVYTFYAEQFMGKPDLITVAGGIDPDQVLKVFEPLIEAKKKHTSHIHHTPASCEAPLLPTKNGLTYKTLSSQYVQVFYAFPGPRHIDDKTYYALEIANAAIGDAMGSRLFQKLREELGICYTIYSSPNLFRDCSLFSIFGTCSVNHAEKLLVGIHEEMQKIAAKGFSEEEIHNAKSHLAGMITIAAQDVEYRMRRLARQALYKSTIIDCSASIKKIHEISVSDVQESIGLFMQNEPILFGAGPQKAEKRFSRQLEQIIQSR